MKLYDLADILDTTIELNRHPNQDGRWTAKFKNCDTKRSKSDPMLTGTYGDAGSPMAAIEDYASQIKGMLLVFNAGRSEDRKEFVAPKDLTI